MKFAVGDVVRIRERRGKSSEYIVGVVLEIRNSRVAPYYVQHVGTKLRYYYSGRDMDMLKPAKPPIKTVEDVFDKAINEILDYTERMQTVKSPMYFLGRYKTRAIKDLDKVFESVLGEDDEGGIVLNEDPRAAHRNELRAELRKAWKEHRRKK